jgi:acetyltransferase
MNILCEAPEVDALLVMHAPTAMTDGAEIAAAVVDGAKRHLKVPVMTCWVGGDSAAPARKLFAETGIPSYETPDEAVRSFLHLVEYRRNQDMLMQTPPSAPAEFTPDTAAARALIAAGLAAGARSLDEPTSKAILDAYGIPTVPTRVARNPVEASRIAGRIPGPVALKILSPDVGHKSDVGGVVLDLSSPFEVEKAAHAMRERVLRALPSARIEGFTVQETVHRPGAQELFIGVTTDPVFGPVIVFGQGGTAVDVIGDRAVALPPLNMMLARDLISRTRVARLLDGFRDHPPADLDALCLALTQVAQLVIDLPEIVEIDVNPLFADAKGVLALDARIRIAPASGRNGDRLAIRPYPKELEETITLADGRAVHVRPIRPEDEPNHHVFVSKLTPEDIRFRFFGLVHELPHSEMARLTQIDYDREMAFIAVLPTADGEETMGVVRTVTDPDNEKAEFAIVVRSDIKGQGLGKALLRKMIEYCRARGTKAMVGQVLQENGRMLKMIEGMGFRRLGIVDGDVAEVSLPLQPTP